MARPVLLSERDLQRQAESLLDVLVNQCQVIAWYHANQPLRDRRGFPDLCIMLPRQRIVLVEFKVGGNIPTPEQRRWYPHVCRSLEQFAEVLRDHGVDVTVGPR